MARDGFPRAPRLREVPSSESAHATELVLRPEERMAGGDTDIGVGGLV